MTVMFRVFVVARERPRSREREREKGSMDVRRILIWKWKRRSGCTYVCY
jgi:hypothetical protein